MDNKNSIVNRPKNNELDNLDIEQKNYITIEELNKENLELTYVLNQYKIILKEYQYKYGNELYNQLQKQLMNLDEQDQDISYKKNLLESIPIFKEYEKRLKENADYIAHLLEEKANLERDNKSIKEENLDLQSKLEESEKQNNELYNALEERIKSKDTNRIKYNKTFSNNIKSNNINNINIKEDNNQDKGGIGLGDTGLNINNNSNSNIGILFNTMKENYNNLLNKQRNEYKEKIDYEDIINKLKIENNNIKNQLFSLQNKFKQEIDEKTKIENDSNLKQIEIDRLNIDNQTLKKELNEYKDAYNSLEMRKNNETDNLINELKDKRNDIDDYKNKNKRLEEQNSKYKVENAQLKQENDGLKFDRDKLTKIMSDSDMAIQNAIEKEKYADNLIKSYKKKADEINLEKEKLNIKIRMKENQINKINVEYGNLLKEKLNEYEISNNITKNKYEDIIKNKDNEIRELKASILSYKIEKDKYFSDYNLIQSEYDKIYQQFNIENDGYIKKYEESQNKLNNIENEYIGKINDLTIKNENYEGELKAIKNEINKYKLSEKTNEQKIRNLEREGDELKRQNEELRRKNDNLEKQNYAYINERERLKAQHKMRLEKDKEFYENKTIYLENEIQKKNKQLSLAEGKALDMVKKQQKMTEKYKKELENTINHYENIINGRIPENYSN